MMGAGPSSTTQRSHHEDLLSPPTARREFGGGGGYLDLDRGYHHGPDGSDGSDSPATYRRLDVDEYDDDRPCYKPRNRQPYPQYHRGPPPPPNPSNRPRWSGGGGGEGRSAEPPKRRPPLLARERSASVPPKKRHRWDNPGYVKGPGNGGSAAINGGGGPWRSSTPFSRHHGPAAPGGGVGPDGGVTTTVGRAGRAVSTDTTATWEREQAAEEGRQQQQQQQPRFATFLPPTVADDSDDSDDGECRPGKDGRPRRQRRGGGPAKTSPARPGRGRSAERNAPSKAEGNEARRNNRPASKDAAAKAQQSAVRAKTRGEVGTKKEMIPAAKSEARTAKSQRREQFATFLPPATGDPEPAPANRLGAARSARQCGTSQIKTVPVPARHVGTAAIAIEKERKPTETTARAMTSRTKADPASVPPAEGRIPKKENGRKPATDPTPKAAAGRIGSDPAQAPQVAGRIPKREKKPPAAAKRVDPESGIREAGGEKTERLAEAAPGQAKMREFVTFLPPPSVHDEEEVPASGSKRPRDADESERPAGPGEKRAECEVDGAKRPKPNGEEPADATRVPRGQLAVDGSETPHVKSASAAPQPKCKTSPGESSNQSSAAAKQPPRKASSSAVSSTKKKANHIRIRLPKPAAAEGKADEPTASDRDEEVAGITGRGRPPSSTRLKIRIPRAPSAEGGAGDAPSAPGGKRIRIRLTCSPRSGGTPGGGTAVRSASATSESSESPAPWELPRPKGAAPPAPSARGGPAVLSESPLSVPREPGPLEGRGGDVRRAGPEAPRGRRAGTSLSSVIRKSSALHHEGTGRRGGSEARDGAMYDSDSDSCSSSSSSR